MHKLKKLTRLISNPRYWRPLLLGVAAGVEHKQVLRYISLCHTVVDVGANRGQFALIARHSWPGAVIYAFEPLAEPAEVFRRIFNEDDKVQLFQCAIGLVSEIAIMHVSKRDDSSSLLPITSRQSTLFPGTEEHTTCPVKVCRLENVLSPEQLRAPALLKVDVQGFELQTLQGCERLLGCFDYIYVECSFVELYKGQALAYQVIDYLHAKGFFLWGIYNLTTDSSGISIQGDFLFKHIC